MSECAKNVSSIDCAIHVQVDCHAREFAFIFDQMNKQFKMCCTVRLYMYVTYFIAMQCIHTLFILFYFNVYISLMAYIFLWYVYMLFYCIYIHIFQCIRRLSLSIHTIFVLYIYYIWWYVDIVFRIEYFNLDFNQKGSKNGHFDKTILFKMS